MTEQQRYRVVDRRGDVELRTYERCTVADVVVDGSAEQAGNAAFRPLFRYISGHNRARAALAMTAPVIQEAAGEKLAMTAPVLQEPAGAQGRWTVSFVLPGQRPLPDYPAPLDARVGLRDVPARTAAALRWSGRWTERNVGQRTDELLRAVAGAGWRATGDVRWARFDPPWMPAFLRHNEVVVDVEMPAGVRPED